MLIYRRKNHLPLRLCLVTSLVGSLLCPLCLYLGIRYHSSIVVWIGIGLIPVDPILGVILVVDDFMIIGERAPQEADHAPIHSETLWNNLSSDPPYELARLSVYDSFFALKMQDAIVCQFKDVSKIEVGSRNVVVEWSGRDRPLRFGASKAARDAMVARHGACTGSTGAPAA